MKENMKCLTSNRIILHTGGTLRAAVCPRPEFDSRHQMVEVFSKGWMSQSYKTMLLAPSFDPLRSIVVEFIINELDEPYTVTWLEMTRR